MTANPRSSGLERRAEPAVRICVPAGFFERLIAACDFRAITKSAFSRYNPRPSTSKADSSLFFKILLLEYIFDVSSDALRNEFQSHPGLRAFLNIDAKTTLPRSDEVVLFRVKLGWMGFKRLLDAVLEQAKKNKLSEVDCSILEKRYGSPLLVALNDSPAAVSSATPPDLGSLPVSQNRPIWANRELGLVAKPPERLQQNGLNSAPTHQVAPAQRPPVHSFQSVVPTRPQPKAAQAEPMSPPVPPREKPSHPPVEMTPVYAETTLKDTAQIIWANQADGQPIERQRNDSSMRTQLPVGAPPLRPPQNPQPALPHMQRGVTGAKQASSAIPATRSQSAPEQKGPLHPRESTPAPYVQIPRPSLNEFDPLGIDSIFESITWTPVAGQLSQSKTETHRVTLPRAAGPLQTARGLPSASLTPPPSAAGTGGSVSRASFQKEIPHVETELEGSEFERVQPSVISAPGRRPLSSSPSELRKALSTAISSSGKNIKAKAPARPVQSENVGQHISSHPPRPAPSSRFPSRSADLASLVAVAEKRPPFLTRFFTTGLYIVLPLVLVFAVYVFIVFLRNSQPAPLAAESPEVPAVTKEFTEKSLPPQPVQAPPTTANPQETTETASPALQKPEAKRSSSNHVAAVTKPQPRIISPSEENSNKVVRVKDSSVEKAKKQALLLHLRQTYHLDLQDDQYTYEELKDINNRLERESRSPNNQ